MAAETDGCLKCSHPLGLLESVLETDPVPVPGKGELCPECYRNLTWEEHSRYFS